MAYRASRTFRAPFGGIVSDRPESLMDRPVNVISYAGARGEEHPVAVRVEGEAVRVKAIRQMWVETGLEPGDAVRRWFELEIEGRGRLAVYYDETLDGWFCREEI